MLHRDAQAQGHVQQGLLSSLTVIPRAEHNISRQAISDNALKVLYRLNKSGFDAYLVGGGVRDLLLGKKPKDFDIATNATPEEVRKLFRNCRLIGRRFRLAHIMFGREVIEVATFRGHHEAPDAHYQSTDTRHGSPDATIAKQSRHGMLLRDNVYGNIEEDAIRRDFTINSLYYSVADFTVRDYNGGLNDLRQGVVRLIGDPETRYREDPVRMLRAVRFAAKLKMEIAPDTAQHIPLLTALLKEIPSARLFEESIKLLQTGSGYHTWKLLCQYQLAEQLFPLMTRRLTDTGDTAMERMIALVLNNTDQRLQDGLRINPAFLFAAMLWYPLLEHTQTLSQERELPWFEAFVLAGNILLDEQCRTLAIPKRLTAMMRDMWVLQLNLPRRQGRRAYNTLEHPKFRAGYDLMLLRAEVDQSDELNQLAQWWETFQQGNPVQQKQLLSELNGKETSKRASRRRRRKPRLSFNFESTDPE